MDSIHIKPINCERKTFSKCPPMKMANELNEKNPTQIRRIYPHQMVSAKNVRNAKLRSAHTVWDNFRICFMLNGIHLKIRNTIRIHSRVPLTPSPPHPLHMAKNEESNRIQKKETITKPFSTCKWIERMKCKDITIELNGDREYLLYTIQCVEWFIAGVRF